MKSISENLGQSFEQRIGLLITEEITRLNTVLEAINKHNGHTILTPRGSRKRKVSNARVLQGKYMSSVRNLPASNKAKVKKIRQTKGYKAAIAEAKRLKTQE